VRHDRIELPGPLVLAGAGNMGGALLAGWLECGLSPRSIVVQDPSPPPPVAALLQQHGIQAQTVIAPWPEPPAVLLMAVKPQVMDDVFPPLARLVGRETVVLSVAAGRTIASYEKHLPAAGAVVRAMPNMAASVGRAITVLTANAHATRAQKALCETLLAAVGEVLWAAEERLMDAVTAVSGSGPAYVFYLTECLAEAGIKAGLEAQQARKLARATVAGAGELLFRSELAPEVLRQNVTSPNGTTFAALQVLMGERGLAPLLAEAVAAAARRSRELST